MGWIKKQKTKNVFQKACDQFIQKNDQHCEIWASSTDWFQQSWGRDTFISLPGILLTNGQYDTAREVFQFFATQTKDGLIPNRILPDQVLYNTADASLWFLLALKYFYTQTEDRAFLAEMLPTIREILKTYHQGTHYVHGSQFHEIKTDTDGLLITPAQATWMDADPSLDGSKIVTPRHGKTVEINALWYAALRFGVTAEHEVGHSSRAQCWEVLAQKVQISFGKFWNTSESCLLDVIEGDLHGGAIRPNQIFAISHGGDLLSATQQRHVFLTVTTDLLTPWGLRTLSPRDSHYQGTYQTDAPMSIKDLAYHQGTVWPWLMGPYIDALFITQRQINIPESQIRKKAETILAPLIKMTMEDKTLPEVFSGDVPHQPGGTQSQAWSVAEVWRVINQYDLK